MKKLEKIKKEVAIGSTSFCNELETDELKAIIESFEKMGATHIYLSANYDRCGDLDSHDLDFYTYREETDEEYDARAKRYEANQREEKAREERMLKAKREKFEQLKAELGE